MRKFALALGLAAGVIAQAAVVHAIPVNVTYGLTIVTRSPALGNAVVGNSTGVGVIQYNGAGLSTLSHGPINLISSNVNSITSTILPGAFNLTGLNAVVANGPGNLASNGAITLAVTSTVTSGYIHCNDLTALGCAIFVMFPATVMLPQTGGVRAIAGAGNLVFSAGQPPGSFTMMFNNVGGSATNSVWTFSEVARQIVPEPATGTLVGLGVLGLAAAGGRKRMRKN
jgi:hypothetical protein